MAQTPFDQFLQETTYRDREPGKHLDRDTLYGLYTSWCCVSGKEPQTEHDFWAAMRERLGAGEFLHMKKCPAVADYILASYPALV
ncbi:hypothetical protein GCM10007170_06650 [Arthrobacter liuii]|uniref:DNA primase/nucleoside triphosphatase C-terminal domain-containing protein n=2 Tax=Arthrobacter liuii TaxID=1476996 RepID=A0ABQ2AJ85_9MICC|nr:hypothetical protein GCM10007170_06650 [Arthrobacter liuii]